MISWCQCIFSKLIFKRKFLFLSNSNSVIVLTHRRTLMCIFFSVIALIFYFMAVVWFFTRMINQHCVRVAVYGVVKGKILELLVWPLTGGWLWMHWLYPMCLDLDGALSQSQRIVSPGFVSFVCIWYNYLLCYFWVSTHSRNIVWMLKEVTVFLKMIWMFLKLQCVLYCSLDGLDEWLHC